MGPLETQCPLPGEAHITRSGDRGGGVGVLGGSGDLVTRVIDKVTILITPVKVFIIVHTKSHEPPSTEYLQDHWTW